MCDVTPGRMKGSNWTQNTHSSELRMTYLFLIGAKDAG